MGLMPHTIFQVMIIASKTSISQDFISMSSTGQAKPYHAQDQPDANVHSIGLWKQEVLADYAQYKMPFIVWSRQSSLVRRTKINLFGLECAPEVLNTMMSCARRATCIVVMQ